MSAEEPPNQASGDDNCLYIRYSKPRRRRAYRTWEDTNNAA